MTRLGFAALLLLAMGCSQQSDQTTVDEEEFAPAQPAGSTIHPAEATGYMDSVDAETFPPTPGDNSVNR